MARRFNLDVDMDLALVGYGFESRFDTLFDGIMGDRGLEFATAFYQNPTLPILFSDNFSAVAPSEVNALANSKEDGPVAAPQLPAQPLQNGPSGAVFELSSLLAANGGDGSAGFIINGIDLGDRSGSSVSSAGDINGDGFDDIIIGAFYGDPNGDISDNSGESYVVFGSGAGFTASLELSALNGANGFVINGVDANDKSGWSVSSAGDINGDGFDDVVIGARHADPDGKITAGESYVVFGSGSGFAASFDLSTLNGINGFVINGVDSSDQSGWSVSSAGDINGDGFDDVIIGALSGDPNGLNSGESYIVFGSGNVFASSLDLSTLNGSNGFLIKGIDSGDGSGVSVSSAGDINGDGFDDIIIGARYADPNGNSDAGESYVVFGSNLGFSASMDLSSLNGSNGFVINGLDADDRSGESVASAGDINGDGFDDIIIGARRADPNGSRSGESYVIFGSDVPFVASLELSSLNGANGFVITGIDEEDRSGISVSSAGDINGDGFDDIIIGADLADPNGKSLAGESYIVFGSGDGFGANLELSTLDGLNGFVINGVDTSDFSGRSVSSAGDVNGDGFDDLIIGAGSADPNGFTSGESYIIFGRADFGRVAIVLTSSDDVYVVANTSEFVRGLEGNDELDGAAASDVLFGDEGDDTLSGNAGNDRLEGGEGNDVLDGGDGNDVAVYNGNLSDYDIINNGDGTYTVTDNVNGNGIDTLTNIEDLQIGKDLIDLSAVTPPLPLGQFELSSLLAANGGDGTHGFILNGIDAMDYSGSAVASAGDVNGDGFDDFIIGASRAGTSGESYVVFGNGSGFGASLELSALDGANGFVINGIDSYDQSGAAISSAGDINGDGFDDILIGAWRADPNGNNSGESYVVFGQASGFSANFDLSTLLAANGGDGTSGFVINGIAENDASGRAVSTAGDVNGDGFDDLIIGAYGADANDFRNGETYIVFGSASVFNPSLELSALNGTNGFSISGIDSSDSSGYSVSSAGDVNGDGFDDIIIGSRSAGSYVVFGQASGFAANISLSMLDGMNGFAIPRIASNDSNGFLISYGNGFSVSSAGDVNGDGFDDVIIGDPNAAANGDVDAGESYVVFGRGTAFTASFQLSSLLVVNGGDGTDGFVISGIEAGDRSGNSVSSAGDVNGDGIDDLLIGAPNASINGFTWVGESYVVYGTDSGFTAELDLSTLNGSNGFVINGIDAFDVNGSSVSAAGDVNGDGFDDILIGARFADPNGNRTGESYIIFGRESSTIIPPTPPAPPTVFELFSLRAFNGGDGSAGFVINGISAEDNSGGSVASAGDINGDGFDDLIIGASGGDPNGILSAGESYIVFGNVAATGPSLELSALNGTNGFVINGIENTDASGGSVSSAGDINGDGFDDVIIGAVTASPNGDLSGESYVVFGSETGFAASLDLSTLDGTNGFVINGIGTYDFSGSSVSSAGDINGDGFDDIIIGAPRAGPNRTTSGETYIIFGNSTGFDASLELSELDGNNGFLINGVDPYDYSGISVSSAGDLNGDGFDDVVIGAFFAYPNGDIRGGETYVVFGSSSSFGASFDLSSLNGTNGFVLNGIDAYDLSGASVSSVGDVNGDGFDDIGIGAGRGDPNGDDSGESYVVYGTSSGFAASLELSALNGTNGFVINGVDAGDNSGSISSAGDFNGDGIDDLIIGAGGADPNGNGSGESYVVFGNTSGFGASFELSTLDGFNGFVLNGISASDGSGGGTTAGDLNSDGYDDLIIGAFGADPNGSESGQSYVIYGGAEYGRVAIALTTSDDVYSVANSGEVVRGLEGNDALNGAAGSDVLFGDEGDDTLSGNAGNDRMEGGEGNDLIDGGDGQDVAVYDGTTSDYAISDNGDGTFTITDTVNGNGVDTLSNVEFVRIGTEVIDLSMIDTDINGTTGNDNPLNGTAGDDLINGLEGNDRLFGLVGDDILNGDDGADTLIGGLGADALNGGAGFDSADYRGAASSVGFNVETGGTLGEALGDSFSGIERYYLSTFNDIITGSDANEFFYGEGGNDQINGGGGIDRIYGGDGNDIQRGQDGNDTLYGSVGNDQLNGGTGFDIANYSLASAAVIVNMLTGGTGGDAAGDTYFGIEAVYGSDFDDSLTGNNSVNELRGGDGDDALFGLGGNDRFFGGEGADSFDGGTGTDIVNYTLATSGVQLDLVNGGIDGEAFGDSYINIEWVFGSEFFDYIIGDAGANRIEGRGGFDHIEGGAGNDRLLGGDGNDFIFGGAGIDTIFGQNGNDNLDGGSGNDFFFGSGGGDFIDGGPDFDTVSYLSSSSGVIVDLSAGGTGGDADGDTYQNVERVFGTSFDDVIAGSSSNDVLLGNGGSDFLTGRQGNDALIGGAGTDSFGYSTSVGDADVINDFFGGETIFILGGNSDFDTWAEVQAVGADAGANVIFDFGGGNTLTIVGRNLADLDASDFDFSGTAPASAPLSDPDAFAADIFDVFDMYALF